MAFVAAGVPGLLIAVVVALVIREPRRAIPRAERPKPTESAPYLAALFLLFCGCFADPLDFPL